MASTASGVHQNGKVDNQERRSGDIESQRQKSSNAPKKLFVSSKALVHI